MKKHDPFTSSAGTSLPLLLAAVLCAAPCLPRADADTAYAGQVVDYTPGTGLASGYTDSAAALGQPGNASGGVALNPFSPNYGSTQLTGIGAGGQLTLALSNFVTVAAAGTPEIGIFGNVGLINAGTGPNAARRSWRSRAAANRRRARRRGWPRASRCQRRAARR